MVDLYHYRSMRKGIQVSDIPPGQAVTEQPQAAQAAGNVGGFKGLKAAVDHRNPLLWVLLLILILSGIIAASFHLRVAKVVSVGASV